MHPREDMSAVFSGVRYSVKTATLLAHDEWWNGHNFEQHGRNTFLYKGKNGRFFSVHLTQWQNERDHITPLEEGEAIRLYELLPVQEAPYENAFGKTAEEA